MVITNGFNERCFKSSVFIPLICIFVSILLLKPQVSVTEAVSVTGWRCTESRPELETVNK